jgi:hypothetical protein
MKLRNLLLIAALFLSAGAAFATNPHNQEEANTYIPSEHPYTWTNTQNWSKVDVTLTKFQQQEGFKYAVYDTKNSSDLISKFNEIKAVVEADENIAKDNRLNVIVDRLHAAGYNNIWLLKEPAKGNGKNQSSSAVTVIQLPEETSVEEFGVIEYNHSVFSDKNITNNFFFYTNDSVSANTVFYGKVYSDSGDGNNKSARVTFGQPLPAPIVTLLIALGFGAALVMYRNRKQEKA